MPSSDKPRKSQPDHINRRNVSPRKRTSVRRSLSLSSSSSSPVEQRQRQARPRSRSLSSNSGDSSINTPVDRRSQRRTASTLHGASGRLFTQTEDRVIIRSLRRKLLVNDGKRLNRIERQLLRAMDHRGRGEDGWVSTTAFEDALMTDGKASDGGEPVTRDESLWLSEKLESRNRKKVSCFRIRSLLTGGDDEGLGVGSGKSRRYHDDNRVHRSRHSRKWAVRRGTVGQWLQDVASPMENKLFFEFIKGLEKFEHRNGLDHYRISSTHKSNRSDGDDGWKDGTTVVHLGPMLKAAIRFYV